MHIIVVNQLQLIVIINKKNWNEKGWKTIIQPTLLMKNKNAVKHSQIKVFLYLLASACMTL